MYSWHTSRQRLLASPFLLRWPGARRGLVIASCLVLGLTLWATAGLALAHAPASQSNPLAESLTQDLVALGMRYQVASGPT